MLKRIRQLSKGIVEHKKQKIQFSQPTVTFRVEEGKVYEGTFSFEAEDHSALRGILYCTSSRMECLTGQFGGRKALIRYRFSAKGLAEGAKSTGTFEIILDQQTISLPFEAAVYRKYPESSQGPICSISDFAILARENQEEARNFFRSPAFEKIIAKEQTKERMLYRGLIGGKDPDQAMEEFLIAAGKKEKVLFEAKLSDDQTFIDITKSGWGYLKIHVSADRDFLKTGKRTIVSSDFAGNAFRLSMDPDPEAMHAGNNYCRIRLENAYQTRTFQLKFHKDSVLEKKETDPSVLLRRKLTELYVSYCTRRIVTGVWTAESVKLLDELEALEEENDLIRLYKAYCLALNHQTQDADWILTDFRKNTENKTGSAWAFYLYVYILTEHNEERIERFRQRLDDLYEQNKDDDLMCWIYYKSLHQRSAPQVQLEYLENFMQRCPGSAVIYAESCLLIRRNPQVIDSLFGYQLQVLRWTAQHKGLTENLINRLFEIAEESRRFQTPVYRLLCEGHRLMPEEDHIRIICRYILRGNSISPKYKEWYELGIRQEIHLVGLYEAYLRCMKVSDSEELPASLRMYFQYDTNVPYQNLAVLYTNIIAAGKKDPELYASYQKNMAHFTFEQIQKEHINDNLAVIYSSLMTPDLMNEKIAQKLDHIIFTRKITVDSPHMKHALVYQWPLKEPAVCDIANGIAYAPVFSDNYALVFEDEKGIRYAAGISYTAEELMDPAPYCLPALKMNPTLTGFLLYQIQREKPQSSAMKFLSEGYFQFLMNEKIDPVCKAEVLPDMVKACQENGDDEYLTRYLWFADFAASDAPARTYLGDMMAHAGIYTKAWELMQDYGADSIGPAERTAVLCSRIQENSGESDDRILAITAEAFLEHSYHKITLKYLCDFYSGPIELMQSIWKIAQRYSMDTMQLEERILFTALFSGWDSGDIFPVFDSYRKKDAREILVNAYLTVCCDRYITEDKKTDPLVFLYALRRENSKVPANDICRLALLKHLAEEVPSDEKQLEITDHLLGRFASRGEYYPFYASLPEEMQVRYQVSEYAYAFCKAEPGSRILIHYSGDEDGNEFHTEDMREVYPGIFVRPFTMFFGDVIRWYTTDEKAGNVESGPMNRLTYPVVTEKTDGGRFGRINRMGMDLVLKDQESFEKEAAEYNCFENITEELFRML